jgi:hypothetical protein
VLCLRGDGALFAPSVRADIVTDSYSLLASAGGMNGEYSPAADGFARADTEWLTADSVDGVAW